MAGYNWTFTVLPNTITEIILNEVITVQKRAGQFEANYFVEGTDVTISADGYQTKTVTVGDEQITLIADIKYLSKLSNGTATYVIKDANAVHTEDVTSTYSPTGTAPVNGMAVASALPTVNNSTITITQGGVTKGSFTLNQSSGDTIALDGGGDTSDFVTKSTNQDITGLKTIVKTEGSVFLEEKASDVAFDTAPTTDKSNQLLRFIDSSGNLMGYLEYARFADGRHKISLVDKKNGTTSLYSVIGAGWDANGNAYATAPTPTNAEDNSDVIATTSWVRNHCCTTAATTTSTASKDAPAYIIENYINGASWYRLWSDGWCEQGGHYDKGSLAIDTATTIQLLKAYPNINYTLVAQSSRNDNQGGGINNQVFINYRTTTEFTARCYGDGTSQYIDWYACGYTS